MINIKLFKKRLNRMYISSAKGKYLDTHAKMYNLERKKYFWIFKESDRKLRRRIYSYIMDYSRHQIKTIHEDINYIEKRFRERD